MADIILETFQSRIKEMGLVIEKIDEQGLVHISNGEETLEISLENVRKSYQLQHNFDHLDNLIDSIQSHVIGITIPTWQDARHHVYYNLFPATHDFGEFMHEAVTSDFHKCYVYDSLKGYFWINKKQLDKWEVEETVFMDQVKHNMHRLAATSIVGTHAIETHQLAFIETEFDTFKSAIVISEHFKEKIQPVLGWPVYCVIPVRDFCYIFSETAKEFFMDRLGSTVLKEYADSGYEITTEILMLSDDGIEVIGKYEE